MAEEKTSRYRDHLASNIGLSGFKQLLGPEANVLRRCAWLLVIVLALGWMLWNIHGQVAYFLSYPTAVTTELVYPGSLPLPDITICNQNLFRATEVFNMSAHSRKSPTLYEALDHYFRLLEAGRGSNSNRTEIDAFARKYGHLLEFPDVEKFYLQMAHQKESMINKCLWRGRQCGPWDFRPVMTDLGLCFRFAPHLHGNQTPPSLTSPGPSGGLDLLLQLEQYRYMRGLREGVGVVVMVTEAGETAALASQRGLGVSAGTRSSLALRQHSVRELPAPHGTCSSRPLPQFPPDTPYTPLKCQLDCLTSHVRQKCGCVDLHMPRPHSSVPYCSLLEKLRCVEPAEDQFYRAGGVAGCRCPERCQAVTFQTSLSSSRLSPLSLLSQALEAPPALESVVNRSMALQSWAMLNKLDPGVTDDLAETSAVLADLYSRLGSLRNLTSHLEVNVSDLLEAAEAAGLHERMTSLTAMMTKPLANGMEAEYDKGMRVLVGQIDTRITSSSSMLEQAELVGRHRMWVEASMAADVLTRRPDLSATVGGLWNHAEAMGRLQADLANLTQVLVAELRGAGAVPSWQLDDVTESLATMAALISNVTEQQRLLRSLEKRLLRRAAGVRSLDSRDTSITAEFFRDNLLHLEVFLEELSVHETRKEAAYSVEGLVCDIGGSIGLCLGGSVLTFIEILDLLLVYQLSSSGRARKKREGQQADVSKGPGVQVWGVPEPGVFPPPGDLVKTKL